MIQTELGRKIVIAVIAAVALFLVIAYIIQRLGRRGEEGPPPEVQRVREETRRVTIL